MHQSFSFAKLPSLELRSSYFLKTNSLYIKKREGIFNRWEGRLLTSIIVFILTKNSIWLVMVSVERLWSVIGCFGALFSHVGSLHLLVDSVVCPGQILVHFGSMGLNAFKGASVASLWSVMLLFVISKNLHLFWGLLCNYFESQHLLEQSVLCRLIWNYLRLRYY
jgi:hypothetical protein